jgi:hypothetical protein
MTHHRKKAWKLNAGWSWVTQGSHAQRLGSDYEVGVSKDGTGEFTLRVFSKGTQNYAPDEPFCDPSVAMNAGDMYFRTGGKRRRAPVGPPWLRRGEKIIGEATVGGSQHRRVTPRILLSGGKVPAHLQPPTKSLAELQAAYDAVNKLLK